MTIIASDPFAGRSNKPFELFDNMQLVTPSDTDELPVVASFLWVSSKGAVKVTTAGGQDFTFGGPASNGNLTDASSFLGIPSQGQRGVPIRIRKVWATGTTATQIWALW